MTIIDKLKELRYATVSESFSMPKSRSGKVGTRVT